STSRRRDDLPDLDAALVTEAGAPLRDVNDRLRAVRVHHNVTAKNTGGAEVGGPTNAIAEVCDGGAQLLEPLRPLGLLGVAGGPPLLGSETQDKLGHACSSNVAGCSRLHRCRRSGARQDGQAGAVK